MSDPYDFPTAKELEQRVSELEAERDRLREEPQRLLRELLATLDRNFAQAISPADAWSDALIRVGKLKAEVTRLREWAEREAARYDDAKAERDRLREDCTNARMEALELAGKMVEKAEAEREGFRLEAARWRREADAALESEKRIEAERDRLAWLLTNADEDNDVIRAERDRLREALDFYAYGGGRDSGLRARRALEGTSDECQ